jgi:hypothetical protein
MNHRPRLKWLLGTVLILVGIFYTYFVWQYAGEVLVRHGAVPGGRFGLDLDACLQSERAAIRLAAAQRVADGSMASADLLPIIRSVWASEERVQEVGWFFSQAVARMDDDASDAIALVAMSGFKSAVDRFEKLPAAVQAESLLRLLDQQDLETDRGAGLANAIALRLGSLGGNADFELPPYAESDRLSRLISWVRVDAELAAKIAVHLLERFRDHELSPALELALVQLGKPALAAICESIDQRLRTDVHFSLRLGLYRTLTRLGRLASEAASALIRAIEFEPVNHAFAAAVSALVAIEPDDRMAAGNAIRTAKVDKRWETAGYNLAPIHAVCESALRDLGDDETIDAMIAELQGQRANEAGVRIKSIDSAEVWQTVRKLGQCGARAIRAEAILAECLNSRATSVQIEATWAFVRVGGEAQRALEVLASFLDPRQTAPEDLGLALVVIAEIGWPNDWSAEPLLRLLESEGNSDVRILASNALQKIYPDGHDLTDVFVRRLVADPDSRVRRVIMKWLDVRLSEGDSLGIPTIELPNAVQWLRENWSASRQAKSTGEQELQVWLAERSVRAAGAEGAVALAEWIAEDPNCPPRAIDLFDDLGDARQAALPVLRQMLHMDEPEAGHRAVVRLERMRTLAGPVYSDVAATQFPETDAAMRAIDPRAYVASSSRIIEWIAVWLTPIVWLIGLVNFGRACYNRSGGNGDGYRGVYR